MKYDQPETRLLFSDIRFRSLHVSRFRFFCTSRFCPFLDIQFPPTYSVTFDEFDGGAFIKNSLYILRFSSKPAVVLTSRKFLTAEGDLSTVVFFSFDFDQADGC